MAKSSYKKHPKSNGSDVMQQGALRQRASGAGFRAVGERFREQWDRYVKMPIYREVARRRPGSRIARKYFPEPEREALHAKLVQRVGARTQPYDLMLFGIINWHFRIQRPQQLCRQFARMGYRVFYIETAIHLQSATSWNKPGFSLVDSPEPNAFVCQLHCGSAPADFYRSPMTEAQRQDLARGLENLRRAFGIRHLVSLVEYPFWRPLVESLWGNVLVYDCLDHLAGFSTATPEMKREELRLLEAADLVVTSSAALGEQVGKTAESLLVRNGVEYNFFSRKPETIQRPSDRPVVGYYGAIAEWFDMKLVVAAAQAFREWDFWLIGAATPENVAIAAEAANVILTGEVPYAELTQYLYGMDVCMIPFQESDLTRCTNPVKVYEYLAAGKSVVATWMPELELMREHVHVARSATEFISCLRAAMAKPLAPEEIRARTEWAARQDWSTRARQIEEHVGKHLPLVSIIILTYNNLSQTQACLASLIEFTDYPNYELVLVDNASTDGSVEFLRDFARQHQHVRLVLNAKNTGFAAGNNAGIRTAKGDYLVLLNNDTYCTRGWLWGLLRHLLKHQDLGAIGPITNNIGNEAKVDLAYSNMKEMAAVAGEYTNAHARELLDVNVVAFFCVVLPRWVVEKVGGLDESFGIGFFEDDDYCNRIRREGFRICIADDVFIHHDLSASFNKLATDERNKLFEQNLKTYEAKWGKWVSHQSRAAQPAPAPFLARIPKPAERLPFTGERYTSAATGQIQHEHYHRYLFALELCHDAQVLDVASGEGYGTALLGLVAISVLGVDNDQGAIDHARRHYAGGKVSFQLGDATRLQVETHSKDVVVSFETLEHLRDHHAFLSEIKRVLKTGGLAIVSTPDQRAYNEVGGKQNPFHLRELSRERFEGTLRAFFKHVQIYGQTPVCGSCIVPAEPAPVKELRFYDRAEEDVYAIHERLPKPIYLIALASDSGLPELRCSWLHDKYYAYDLEQIAKRDGA